MSRSIKIALFAALLLVGLLPVQAHVVVAPGPPSDEGDTAQPLETITRSQDPAVVQLSVDDDYLYQRAYRKINGVLTLYDAAGTPLQNMGDGPHYVTAGQSSNGLTQVTETFWVPSNSLEGGMRVSDYAGVLLPDDPLPYTLAWIIKDIRPSQTPGGPENTAADYVQRFTRTYIYDTAEVDGYRWYKIGPDAWVHQFNMAKVIPVARPDGTKTEKWISVDLYEQVLIAYEGEKPVFATLISSGLPQWSTGEGLFHVYLRLERHTLTGSPDKSLVYFVEDVPHLLFFDGDIAIHGTYWHNGFGFRQSHGCVNLSLTDSKWIYEWSVDQYDPDDNQDIAIYVYSSGEFE